MGVKKVAFNSLVIKPLFIRSLIVGFLLALQACGGGSTDKVAPANPTTIQDPVTIPVVPTPAVELCRVPAGREFAGIDGYYLKAYSRIDVGTSVEQVVEYVQAKPDVTSEQPGEQNYIWIAPGSTSEGTTLLVSFRDGKLSQKVVQNEKIRGLRDTANASGFHGYDADGCDAVTASSKALLRVYDTITVGIGMDQLKTEAAGFKLFTSVENGVTTLAFSSSDGAANLSVKFINGKAVDKVFLSEKLSELNKFN